MIVLAVLLSLAVLLCVIPLGINFSFRDGAAALSAVVSFKKFVILPKKETKLKKNKPKTKEKVKKNKEPFVKRLGFSASEWLEAVKTVLSAVKRLFKKLRFQDFKLVYVSAGDDPYDVIMNYNYACAAAYTMMPLMHLEERQLLVDTDFNAEKSVLELDFKIRIRTGQLLLIALIAAVAILKLYLRHKSALLKERKIANGKQIK